LWCGGIRRPESWEPLPEEAWIKNVDERGNTYYYHILTGESRCVSPPRGELVDRKFIPRSPP
jgi:hypothetical protein